MLFQCELNYTYKILEKRQKICFYQYLLYTKVYKENPQLNKCLDILKEEKKSTRWREILCG